MNVSGLQADLRHFAAERDWQPLHSPKSLSTALMVEAAELVQIFQWMTSEESRHAHEDARSKERIGEAVADVLLYLLQVADLSRIDLEPAIRSALARYTLKYPAKQTIARVSPTRAAKPGTHVLLDYENVQPTEDELRALVPDANEVWIFHGPHQRHVDQRFASFGASATAVPISRPAGTRWISICRSTGATSLPATRPRRWWWWRTTKATSRCWNTPVRWGSRCVRSDMARSSLPCR